MTPAGTAGGTICPTCASVSTDAEFCSECGAMMVQGAAAPSSAAIPPAPPAPGAAEPCPVCGEARPGAFARYCDNCRYDFLSKQPFAAAAAPAAPSLPVPAVPPEPVAAPGVVTRWDLHGTVDVTLRRPEDPMPTDLRPRIYPLDLADHLIGRRSDNEDIHPEITVTDPGISRRHARILRGSDGSLTLLDLGSMNGTRLNGAAAEPNVATPLHDGDALTLGCWTRLVVRAR